MATSLSKKRLVVALIFAFIIGILSFINVIAYLGQSYSWFTNLTIKHYIPRLIFSLGIGSCLGLLLYNYKKLPVWITFQFSRLVNIIISIFVLSSLIVYTLIISTITKLLPYFPPFEVIATFLLILSLILSLQFENTKIEKPVYVKRFGENTTRWLEKYNIPLYLTLLIAIPLLFMNVIKEEFPLGFAGLYTLMAESIAKANFHLPLSVPFYGGPGGMPFAYPPFGLYLMAIFLKMGISSWIYLKYAPPLFSLFALVPLFLIARRVSKSILGGMVVSLLAATSLSLYRWQAESGGMIRGLAFALGLLSVYFFYRMIETFRWRDAVFAGVLFGSTVLTHLGYAYFFAIWLIVLTVTHPKKQNLIGACLVGFISAVIILPWVIVIANRYGLSIFLNAYQSHGITLFLSFFQNPTNLLPYWQTTLQSIISNPLLLLSLIAGFECLVIEKKFAFPFIFLLVLVFIPAIDYFILAVSFLIIGYFISFIYRLISKSKLLQKQQLLVPIPAILLLCLFIPFYFQSLNQLRQQNPIINLDFLDVGSFLRDNTPPETNYLVLSISKSEAQEWLPYLSLRQPVLVWWGSEWLGTYNTNVSRSRRLNECIKIQSITCLDSWIESQSIKPDYIILETGINQLITSLEESPGWQSVYSNSRFVILAKIESRNRIEPQIKSMSYQMPSCL